MNVINMSIRPVQVNTNFLNSLPPEWSKFVTDVKLARDLHRTNYDQLYSYLKQHENHANETRLMRERYQGLAIPVFNQGDDPIACLNKAMAFLTAVAFSRFPSTNNQPRTSSNPRNQATIQDRRVIDGRLGWLSVINVKLKVTWLGNALSQKGIGMLHDLGIPDGQTAQTTIPNTATFQTGDLDGYDSDCDDVLNAKAVLMANLSSYGSDVLSEKAQRIKPTLYDGSVISSQHVASPVIDDEETLILEENCFVERAFRYKPSHPNTNQSTSSPVKIKAPRELPKESFTNNQNALEILEYFENNDLKTQLQAKDTTIWKETVENVAQIPIATTVAPGMFKIDLEALAPSEKMIAITPMNKVKKVRFSEPLRSSSNIKQVVKIVLWYLDSECSKRMTGNHSQLMNFVSKFLGTVQFGNDQVAKIMGYGDYQLGNVIISRVYYVEGLGHNLFSVEQFCDADLEAEDTNQEKLYLFHMDLCGPMRVESINEKKYILVIVDDYSRFTWVRFLRSKDEAPDTIIKCIKNIYVCLNATIRNVRTDNGTEFVNQTLRDFYENVSISHQTSVARTPQQNGVVKRQNQTLVEAARTMLIFLKAPLFLWAKEINTACYTQNNSLIRLCYSKTPYELMHDKKSHLSLLHVFGSLCYPTNDSEDLGKLNAKADIGIFCWIRGRKESFQNL
ncbi:retrovirus-related pol polyprotein from transposon TNT 1-94 [Tanacetum coccineum]|uniref:Retrovirus-related pol polyprotein from transposon TNT 1-94 n=1 Tax=Tanacetum coccineum TaxID=301880 RepID=A0ABQ5EB55_9ASTR